MREREYRVLREIAKGQSEKQKGAFFAIGAAMIRGGQARSFMVGWIVARLCGTLFKSGLQRFYRWVHNPRFDEWACWVALAERLLPLAGRRPVVALDWTEWPHGLRVLTAGLCLGGRAIPILAQCFPKALMPRSQNTRENGFVGMLTRLHPLLRRAVLVFDRGFRRASLILALRSLGQPYLIRLVDKVHASGARFAGLLSAYPLARGQLVDLGMCQLRLDGAVKTRIIGVWTPDQDEPWWLATSLSASPGKVVRLYMRRMEIEEHFRDAKGARYGIRMRWTGFRTPAAVDRLYLLAAVALIVWWVAGHLLCLRDRTAQLISKAKGPRRSLIAIGRDAGEELSAVLARPWASLIQQLGCMTSASSHS
jgi:hypothetical protein